MTNTNITNLRKNLFEYIDQAVTFGEPINVNTKNGNAIIMSEAEYNGLVETLHLKSIPGMMESILSAAEEPLSEGVPAEKLEW